MNYAHCVRMIDSAAMQVPGRARKEQKLIDHRREIEIPRLANGLAVVQCLQHREIIDAPLQALRDFVEHRLPVLCRRPRVRLESLVGGVHRSIRIGGAPRLDIGQMVLISWILQGDLSAAAASYPFTADEVPILRLKERSGRRFGNCVHDISPVFDDCRSSRNLPTGLLAGARGFRSTCTIMKYTN